MKIIAGVVMPPVKGASLRKSVAPWFRGGSSPSYAAPMPFGGSTGGGGQSNGATTSPLEHHAEHGVYNGFVHPDGSFSSHIGSHETFAKSKGFGSVSGYLQHTGAVRVGIAGHSDSPSKVAYASSHADKVSTPAQHAAVSGLLEKLSARGFKTHVERHDDGDRYAYKPGATALIKSWLEENEGGGGPRQH